MDEHTKRCLNMCTDLRNYYTLNKHNINHTKVISNLLPLLNEIINTYNQEFENSIAYLQLHNEEKAKKRDILETCCTFIYEAIRKYSEDKHNLRYHDFKDYTQEQLRACTDEELSYRLAVFMEVVQPMIDDLLPYGITNTRLKALGFHLSNFRPALPVHITEIEKRKNAYRSALNCIGLIEEYLQL